MDHLQWHPMMVHFPLALTFTAAACLIASQCARHVPLRQSLAVAGSWNLIFGGATVLVTLGTGLWAVSHVQLAGGAQYTTTHHVIWAICTSQVIVLLALWRGFAAPLASPPGRLFLAFLLIGCAGLIVTGYYGGENVYHYALGVQTR